MYILGFQRVILNNSQRLYSIRDAEQVKMAKRPKVSQTMTGSYIEEKKVSNIKENKIWVKSFTKNLAYGHLIITYQPDRLTLFRKICKLISQFVTSV